MRWNVMRASVVVVIMAAGVMPAPGAGAVMERALCVAAAGDIAGRWEGKVSLPGVDLGFDVDFKGEGEGYKGDISIPMQNAKDLPLDKIKVTGFTASQIYLYRVPERR